MPKSREELERELAKEKKFGKAQKVIYGIMVLSSIVLLWSLFA